VLFASADFAAEASRLSAEVPGLKHVFLMDTTAPGTELYDPWLERQATSRVETAKTLDDLCFISYTAGSTGKPKGVQLTHRSINWQALSVRRAMLCGPDDRCLLAVPMFHGNGMQGGLFAMLGCGGSVVILHDVDPAAMIEAIARERCTYTTGVPAMYKMMLRQEELLARTDCSSLRFVICGSSEVPEDLLAEFTRRMAPMLECYGLTECGFVTNNPRWGITKQGTAGIPYPDVEVRIVDPAHPETDVPVGETGELAVRCPGNMVGYRNLPQVTAERFLPGGWIRTRDMVRSDEQGYIEIIGRIDDRISCAGENIYPKEVENVLMEHADVADVAVVPLTDEVKGEVPVAFVVEKQKGALSAEALKQFFLANGAPYMHPRRIFFLDEMPLTSAKKVDRAALRALAEEARAKG
jgi:long-chain acyl-CoA synthetase